MPENNDSAANPIEVKPIPEQTVVAGREVQLDLSSYFATTAQETLRFTIADFPEGLTIDADSGMVTGKVPQTEIKLPMFVSVTAIGKTTEESATLYFPLTLVPAPAELTPESELEDLTKQGLVTDIMEDKSFWEAAREWE